MLLSVVEYQCRNGLMKHLFNNELHCHDHGPRLLKLGADVGTEGTPETVQHGCPHRLVYVERAIVWVREVVGFV